MKKIMKEKNQVVPVKTEADVSKFLKQLYVSNPNLCGTLD